MLGVWGVWGIARNDARCFSFYKTFSGRYLGFSLIDIRLSIIHIPEKRAHRTGNLSKSKRMFISSNRWRDPMRATEAEA